MSSPSPGLPGSYHSLRYHHAYDLWLAPAFMEVGTSNNKSLREIADPTKQGSAPARQAFPGTHDTKSDVCRRPPRSCYHSSAPSIPLNVRSPWGYSAVPKQTQKDRASEQRTPPTASSAKVERVTVAAEALPRRTLEKALAVAKVLQETYAGKSASWDEIAKVLEMSSINPNFRYLIWSAQAYGIVNKEDGKKVSLSETGRKILKPTYSGEDREAKLKAIMTPTTLSKFYSDYNGHQMPSSVHLPNVLETKYEIPPARVQEAIDLITANGRFAGILEDQGAGQEPVVKLSGFSVKAAPTEPLEGTPPTDQLPATAAERGPAAADWRGICFYITPIGDEDTEVRKHADMLLNHLLEPVAREFGLAVVRADKIERSGVITQQVLEHLVKARLCVADLSFGNPNAFYELGVRHTCQLATIQVIRKGDKIPFDVSQGRTITIDTSDTYTIIDRIESAKRELREHIKYFQSGNADFAEDNPIRVYLPGLKVQIPS